MPRYLALALIIAVSLTAAVATAGNTTDDGFVGAVINDRMTDAEAFSTGPPMSPPAPALLPYSRPVRALTQVQPQVSR